MTNQGVVASPQPIRSINADMFKRLSERLSRPIVVPALMRPAITPATTVQSIATKGKTKIIMTSAVAAQAAQTAKVVKAKQIERMHANRTANADRFANVSRLLDLMSGGTNETVASDYTVVADTLLRILPLLPHESKKFVAQRMATAPKPSHAILSRLLAENNETISTLLLQKCNQIPEPDLLRMIQHGTELNKKMIARRPGLSRACVDAFAKSHDQTSQLELIGNSAVQFSESAFGDVAKTAGKNEAIMSLLVTRKDLPLHVGAELYWHVNAKYRKPILDRCLSDSASVATVLRVLDDVTLQGRAAGAKLTAAELYKAIQEANCDTPNPGYTAFADATLCAIPTIKRIFDDKFGEAIAILLKAMGTSQNEFKAMLPMLQIKSSADNLQPIFDGVSENKAKLLLTYWDWSTQRAGPYAAKK